MLQSLISPIFQAIKSAVNQIMPKGAAMIKETCRLAAEAGRGLMEMALQAVLDSKKGKANRIAQKKGFKRHGMRNLTISLPCSGTAKIRTVAFRQPRKDRRYKSGTMRYIGLELLGIKDGKFPGVEELELRQAALTPSYEVASWQLDEQWIKSSRGSIGRTVEKLGETELKERVDFQISEGETLAGKRVLICADGGRSRERVSKKGRRPKNMKGQGFSTDWKEVKTFSINTFDENGVISKEFRTCYDGLITDAEGFCELLTIYAKKLGIDKAEMVVICADGAPWIQAHVPAAIRSCGLSENKVKFVLDHTHAVQNVLALMEDFCTFRSWQKERHEKTVLGLLWQGDIAAIKAYLRPLVTATKNVAGFEKKLESYFFSNSHALQYKRFSELGYPCGSGAVESGIRRILNMRTKAPGSFWKRANLHALILVRSAILGRRWNEFKDYFHRKRFKSIDYKEFIEEASC